MPEPRPDMLPDADQSQDESKQPDEVAQVDVETPQEGLEATKQEEALADKPAPEDKPPKGYVSYQSLDEERTKRRAERDKRKAVEQELEQLKASSAPSDEDEDDDTSNNPVNSELYQLRQDMAELKRSQSIEKTYGQYPVLAEHAADFDEFLEDNEELTIDQAAKLFLVDRDLYTTTGKDRKGLEKPTAGEKTPPKKGISAAEIDNLMKNQPKLFAKKIQSGEINPDEIY